MMDAREEDRREAAEYVLGTLDAAERSAARARIACDRAFAVLVTLWERRLGPLHELAVSVVPPEGLLQDVLRDLPAEPAVAEDAQETAPADAAPTSPTEAAPTEPSADLRAVAAQAAELLPVPPVVAEAEIRELEKDAGLEAAAPGDGNGHRAAATPAVSEAAASIPEPSPGLQPSLPDQKGVPFAQPALSSAARNPWRVASGLMAIVVLGLGGLLLRDSGRWDKVSLQLAPAAPTQHEAVLTPRSAPRVTIKLDPATRRLEVVGLSVPPEGQTYRLWLVSQDGTRNLLCAFRDPTALAPDLTSWTGQGTAMLEITLEAAGDAPGQGTGEVILAGPLKQL
ncbi:anti-sigma factor domain-containing protein [Roseixanthobacter pseudopolyaromaticivorans]|uniref:anti-sigma factor domain-containing protein n=1 Tax=Xanthobacteraceae TaxID=335928 RepID=UPI00372652F8